MTDRPVVAIIANSLTPYRIHFHRRIVRELPEIRLATLLTHEESNAPWALNPPAEIGVEQFGPGEASSNQSRPANAWHEWRKGGRIIEWLKAHRARAVILGGYNDPGRLRIARWCQKHGVPCFLWGDSNIRGDSSGGWRASLKRTILPRILSLCSGAFCCGSLGRDYFLRYGVPADRIFFSPYEPDYSLFERGDPAELDAVRERFHLPKSRCRLVYSGRLVPEKRVDLLMDGFAAIAEERSEWDLVVLGGGPLRESLEERIPKRLRSRVQWLGFQNDPATIAAIYRACDVLVLPSSYEPWAVVINEAVAAGLAIVSSDAVGAAADLVADGVNGRLFQQGELAGMIASLKDVTQPGRARELGIAGRTVLADWREKADPVAGLRQALVWCRALPE